MSEEQAAKKNTGLIAGIIGGVVAVIAIIVVIIIAVSGGTSIEGKWSIAGAKEGDKEVSMEVLKSIGMGEYTIEFKSDGKGIMKYGEEEKEFTYDKDKKTMTADGDTIEYKIEGKQLILDSDGFTMIYEK